MGVHGLWKLIEEAGKPVPVETLENRILAVDVSIWLHQLVKGFHDGPGQKANNAHLLGLFHRICKLLFFRIKPVFVFDGGVPALKKKTIAQRQKRRARASKAGERVKMELLEKLARQAALGKALGAEFIMPKIATPSKQDTTFCLPPIPDIEDNVSTHECSSSEDEDEYYSSFGDLHSIDVESKDFLALPADMRHAILTELKETRKQNSWAKIREMPENIGDFSSFQMGRLLKRRAVQVSLEEAESEMGGKTFTISDLKTILSDQGVDLSQRIAADNTTRFIYATKSNGKDSTVDKEKQNLSPIEEIDEEKEKEEDPFIIDLNSKEQTMSAISNDDKYCPLVPIDDSSLSDGLSQREILEIIKQQNNSTQSAKLDFNDIINRPSTSKVSNKESEIVFEDECVEKAACERQNNGLSQKTENLERGSFPSSSSDPCNRKPLDLELIRVTEINNVNNAERDTNKLISNSKINNTEKRSVTDAHDRNSTEVPQSVKENKNTVREESVVEKCSDNRLCSKRNLENVTEILKTSEIKVTIPETGSSPKGPGETSNTVSEVQDGESGENVFPEVFKEPSINCVKSKIIPDESDSKLAEGKMKIVPLDIDNSSGEDDFLEVPETSCESPKLHETSPLGDDAKFTSDEDDEDFLEVTNANGKGSKALEIIVDTEAKLDSDEDDMFADIFAKKEMKEEAVDDEPTEEWKPEVETTAGGGDSSYFVNSISETRTGLGKHPIAPPVKRMTAEEMIEMKEKLEKESTELLVEANREERLAATISDQLTAEAQELLRLFGVPYIVAPMEAEAQCAYMDATAQTNGTITDDSDIWLFGATNVYKNFFNQKKYVLQFKSTDIQRCYKLLREDMVVLALLTGSDYTEGLEGVGPVTALEILAKFPPQQGDGEPHHRLTRFTQAFYSGRLKNTPLAKKLASVNISKSFPSGEVVKAYLSPTVNEDQEKFSWAIPDLSRLRQYTREKFGWDQKRTDQTLFPVLDKSKQDKTQMTLHGYFDWSLDSLKSGHKKSKRIEKAIAKLGGGTEGESSTQEAPETKNPRPAKQQRRPSLTPSSRKADKESVPKRKKRLNKPLEDPATCTNEKQEAEKRPPVLPQMQTVSHQKMKELAAKQAAREKAAMLMAKLREEEQSKAKKKKK